MSELLLQRRTVLKVLGASSAAAFFEGTMIGAGLHLLQPKVTFRPGYLLDFGVLLKEEEKEMAKEILTYRKSLGFSGLPSELKAAITEGLCPEKISTPPFKNDLLEKLTPFGDSAAKTLEAVFGNKFTGIVNSVRLNPNPKDGYGYMGSDQSIIIPQSSSQRGAIDHSPEHWLHEGGGHGSDPFDDQRQKVIYPRNLLWKVEVAKWKMLNQSFNVPEQFLNHPDDGVLPLISENLGNRLFPLVLEGDTKWFDSRVSLFQVQKTLNSLLSGKPIDEANTSDKTSFGRQVYDLLRSRQVGFSGEFQTDFDNTLDGLLGEIYAEMIRIAILHPNLLCNNREIPESCEEIISTVQGKKINLSEIRSRITSSQT